MRILTTGLAILLCAASAAAATRKVPQQYATIQAACSAEETVDGDTILVSKKPDGSPYQEWVETGKALKFVGKPGVVWDGHRFSEAGGGYGSCLYVSTEGGPAVVVRGFKFVNGSGAQVTVYGHDVVIRNCTFTNSWDEAFRVYGNGAVVRNCTFVGNEWGAAIYGNGAQVFRNTARGQGEGVFYVYGDDAQVHHNRLDRSGEDEAVYVSGNGAHVYANAIVDAYTGIYVTGNEALVEKNRVSRIEGDETGIDVRGTHNTIEKNVLSRMRGYGIYVYGSGGSEDGDNNVVEANVVRWSSEEAIYIYGNHSRVDGNTVSHSEDSGIYAGESGAYDSVNFVVGNTVSDTFDYGIYVSGGGHHVLDNTVVDSDGYGIYASTPSEAVENIIRGNVVSGFFSGGIYIYAWEAPFDVSDNAVFSGDSWSNGIYVYAPYSNYGWIRDNRVSDVGGNGIQLYAYSSSPGHEMTGNTVSDSGTNWDYGIYSYCPGTTVQGNQVFRHVGAGFYIAGSSSEASDNLAENCTMVGMIADDSSLSILDNTGTGSDGEGFINWGSGTIFTGNTFLGNRLDVTNTNSFTTPNLHNSNTFVTGGATTSPQTWND